jgi:hypothetical protein
MVGTVVFPTPEWSAQGQFAVAGRGPVCCSLRSTVWCPGCWPGPRGWQGPGSRRWLWTRWAGRVPVLRNPTAASRALDSLSIRA